MIIIGGLLLIAGIGAIISMPFILIGILLFLVGSASRIIRRKKKV
jgi:hypothetical protein